MIAQLTTFQGEQIGLLAAQPNWDSGVRISLDLPTDIAKEPITLQESRRVFAGYARYAMSWRTYLPTAKESTELRIFLTRIRGEPIAVPLWPDACEITANVAIGATAIQLFDLPVRHGFYFIIANADFSLWEIVQATSLLDDKVLRISPGTLKAWPAGTLVYPILFGRFADRPKPEAITDERLDVDLKVKENSQFVRRLSVHLGGETLRLVGNHIPTFAVTPLWTVPPNHVRPLDWTEQPDVVYEMIGFLRTEQQRVYDHRNARALELEFFQNSRDDLWKIERLFRILRGTTLRMMMPTWRGDMRLAANTPVPGAPTRITVEPTEYAKAGREPQPGDPFIALIDANNAIDPYQISSVINRTTTVDLTATVKVGAHTAATTILSHLLLGRFMEPTLEWNYITPYLATTRIKFVELPHEYAAPPAPLPEPAYLFIFTETLPVPVVYRFTSYENTIVVPSGAYAGTYTPAPFSFDSVKTGLKLDEERLSFKSFKFTGNPLNKMWPFALDGMLNLHIVEVNAANPQSATAESRFYGDVWSVDSDYNATAIAFGNLFGRLFPRFLMSVTDNYTQFSAPTNIPASAFRIAGTIGARSGQNVNIPGAAGYAKAPNYFAGGWLETGTGANFERRGILQSAPVSPGGVNGVQLFIDRPLLKAQPGWGVDMYPGYDGSIDQCDTKFNNRINFGGHPFIPNVNPAVKAMKAKEVAGGKKVMRDPGSEIRDPASRIAHPASRIPSYFDDPRAAKKLRDEALSWLGTPFREYYEQHIEAGRAELATLNPQLSTSLDPKGPGGGIDCIGFDQELFYRIGATPKFMFARTPADYQSHQTGEKILDWLRGSELFVELEIPDAVTDPDADTPRDFFKPGDILAMKHGGLFHLPVIIDDDLHFVNALPRLGVIEGTIQDSSYSSHLVAVFRLKPISKESMKAGKDSNK